MRLRNKGFCETVTFNGIFSLLKDGANPDDIVVTVGHTEDKYRGDVAYYTVKNLPRSKD